MWKKYGSHISASFHKSAKLKDRALDTYVTAPPAPTSWQHFPLLPDGRLGSEESRALYQ